MGKAAWELVLEAASALTTRGMVEFTRASLLDEVRRLDPHRRQESIGPVIQGMTVNATGGPPSPCGTPLRRISHGVYQLVESARHAPPAPAQARRERAAAAPQRRGDDHPIDIVLVGCVKTKAGQPSPARTLYRSALFDRRRSYAEARTRLVCAQR